MDKEHTERLLSLVERITEAYEAYVMSQLKVMNEAIKTMRMAQEANLDK